MASLKQMGKCIGLSKQFSVLPDFFGYITGAPKKLSLLQQIRLLQGKHIDLNLILVAVESFTNTDQAKIDGAVQATRDIYATVELGVGRVQRFSITTALANGHENIANDSEAIQLTSEWTVHNDAIDVFFVFGFSGKTGGKSPTDGPCDKDTPGPTGSVLSIESDTNTTGLDLGHELGHYLGLNHVKNKNNLMSGTVPNGGMLTGGQGSIMRDHCFVKGGCSKGK